MASHLTSEERDVLAQMRATGHSKAECSRALHRSPSTIFRELERNGMEGRYYAARAQRLAEERQQLAHLKRHKMNRPEVRQAVIDGLSNEWSPDEIAGRLRRKHPEKSWLWISHQAIYTWIHRGHGRPYRHCLRRGGRCHNRPARPPAKMSHTLEHRPAIINERGRCGDWEGDLIVSAGHSRAAVITLVERQTGYVEMILIPRRQATIVRQAIVRRLQPYPAPLRRSVTFDNGTEFSEWEQLAAALTAEIFFTHPHSPWERGTNENTNGLARQYFPKGTRFDAITRFEVQQVQEKLNDRPRKRLKYQTPREILQKQMLSCD